MHSFRQKRALVAAVTLSTLLTGLAHAGSSESIYATAGGENPGKITFYESGRIKSIEGLAVCTQSTKVYDGWVKEVAAIGLEAMRVVPRGGASTPEPTQVRYVDDSGKTIHVLGVDVVGERDTDWDKPTATIAGEPLGFEFFAYSTKQIGPNLPNDGLPLGMQFTVIFDFADADDGLLMSELESDPIIVLTNEKDDAATGSTTPVAFSVYRNLAATAVEAIRLGSPPNPRVFHKGLTSAPIIGQTWDPCVRPFTSASAVDVLFVTDGATNRPLPGLGTLLCDGNTLFMQSVAHGAPFSLAIPYDTTLLGFPMCAQVAVNDAGRLTLTNALDLVVGAQ